MSISEQIKSIKSSLPAPVQLVAVSKTKPISDIKIAYDCGQRIFGENKVQELQEKHPALPKDIQWHMIGHLQTNKVKYIAPFVSLIHGVDSLKLLLEINKQALKNKRTINVLLQFHIATESSKFGFNLEEACAILGSTEFHALQHVKVIGVMGMASFSDNKTQVLTEFQELKNIFDQLREQFFSSNSDFIELSMGMSGDYHLAIEKGSTLVRIGSSIFGNRNYEKV